MEEDEREADRVRERGWRSGDRLEDIDFRHLRVRITGMAGLVHIKALSRWLEVTVEQGISDVERMCVGGTVCVHPGWTASLWFHDKVISRYREMGQSFLFISSTFSMDGWPLIKKNLGARLCPLNQTGKLWAARPIRFYSHKLYLGKWDSWMLVFAL